MSGMRLTGFICIWFCLQAKAQFPQYHFRYYDVSNGLLNNEVLCMSQDAQGFIWIGTSNGINKFDGISFSRTLVKAGPTGPVPAIAIRYICKDRHQKLWIAGDYNGAIQYDPVTNTYQSFIHNEQDPASIGDVAAYKIIEDRDGGIWFAHYFKGVSRYDRHTGKFTRYRKEQSGLGSNSMLNVVCDSKGNLWACTADAGLWQWQKSTDRFVPYPGNASLPSLFVNNITEDRYGNYWLATDKGIVKASASGSILNILNTGNSALKTNHFYNIYCGPDGLIYVCSPDGLHVVEPESCKVHIYQPFPDQPNSPFENRCTNLFFDNHGDLWIQFNEGICYATTKGNMLYNVPVIDTAISTGRYNDLEYLTGNVLWNMNHAGIVSKNLNRGHTRLYQLPAGIINAAKQYGVTFSESKGSCISFYIPSAGVSYLDTQTGICRTLPPVEGNRLFHTDHHKTFCDSRNNLWGVDNQLGLVTFSFRKNQWQIIDPQNKKPKYTLFYYETRFLEDTGHNIWIANPYYTLLKYNYKTNSYKSYKHDPADPFSLSMLLPQALYCDGDGRIWLAGIGGMLDLYDAAKDRFVHFNKGDVFDRQIKQITEDLNHQLWCFTPLGLIAIKKKTIDFDKPYSSDFDFAEYNNRNGINGYYFGNNMILHHPDGRMIFDTKNGICAIYPERLGLNNIIPPVCITGITINGTPLAGQQGKAVSYLDTLYLNHTEHNIVATFAALNYLYPESNTYRYNLEGFETDWHYTTSPNLTATYSNLQPGKYILRIKAANNDGYWNEQGKSLLIIIRPAFWQTWWFRLMIAVTVIVLLYVLYRFRIRQLLKLQQVRNRISRDLHDDIGATVSSVNISAKLLQDNLSNPEKAAPLIDKIRYDVQFVGESLDDIVWSVNPKNDNWEQLSSRMRRYWSDLLEHKDIANRFIFPDNIDPKKPIRSDLRKELFLIFKEATNNIAKHSKATEASCIIVINDTKFTMTIADNGTGFDPDAETGRNGIKNMQTRAQTIRGDLSIISTQSSGTLIVLSAVVN